MPPYKVKGGSIDAMQYTRKNVAALTAWCGGVEDDMGDQRETNYVFVYPSLNSRSYIHPGMYLIKAPNGLLKPMPQKEFEDMYEPVTSVKRAGPQDFQGIKPGDDRYVMING